MKPYGMLQRRIRAVRWTIPLMGLALLCTMSLVVQAAPNPAPGLPNVILVVLDTVRWDCAGILDQANNDTPVLRRLARGGYVFNKTYSTYDGTKLSHFSIFTGLERMIPPDGKLGEYDLPENSLPYHLRQLGYFAVGVSANYLLSQQTLPFLRPFDVYRNICEERTADVIVRNPSMLRRVKSVLDRFDAPFTEGSARLIVSDAVDVLEAVDQAIARRPDSAPLFLFINFMDAHDPYLPSRKFYDLKAEAPLLDFYSDVRTRFIPPWTTIIKDKQKLDELNAKFKVVYRYWSFTADLTEEHVRRYKDRYKAEIRYLDSKLERLFEHLKARGLLEKSLVIITSDHGEAFGEEDLLTHSLGNKYASEVLHHVPLIFLPEKRSTEGPSVVEEQITQTDLLPTLHDILGIDYDADTVKGNTSYSSGKSFAHLLQPRVNVREKQTHLQMQRRQEQEPESDQRDRLKTLGYL
jgi:arylsulfatase A-like enzyme